MKLSVNLGAAIVALLFLMSMVGMRADLADEFVREYNAPIYAPTPPPPPPDPATLPAFTDAVGWGSFAGQHCRDSVINGSWGPPKVWLVDTTTYSTAVGAVAQMGIKSILRDSVSDNAWDFVIFTAGGMVTIGDTSGATHEPQLHSDKDCVYVSGAPAQGGGVVLRSLSGYGLLIRVGDSTPANDNIWRDLRAWGNHQYGSHNTTSYMPRYGSRNYIDHMSFHGGPDDHSSGGDSVTIAHTIYANLSDAGLDGTSTLFLRGWCPDAGELFGTTFARNFYSQDTWRMPAMNANCGGNNGPSNASHDSIGDWEVVNTISYHSKATSGCARLAETGGPVEVDWINGILATNQDQNEPNSCTPIHHWECRDLDENPPCASEGWLGTGRLYTSGMQYWEAGVSQGSDWAIYRTESNQPIGDSIKRASRVTQPPDSIIPWTVAQTYDSLLSESPRVMVGAGRRLSCDGQFVANRDSTDQLILNHFVNNGTQTDAQRDSAWESSFVYRDSVVYAAGCPDTDSDGLPDAYEQRILGASDSLSLPFDSVSPSLGYLAIELYLDGRHFNADPGGGTTPVSVTYGDGRNAYQVPVVQETVITVDTLGAVVDTFITRRVDRDSVESGSPFRAIVVADRDSAVVLTYDTMIVPGAGVLDSAAVDSILADYGLTYPPYPWSITVPGSP